MRKKNSLNFDQKGVIDDPATSEEAEENMRKRTLWHHEYRGINIEISHHHVMDEHGTWCFYLHLSPEQFPEEVREKILPPVKETSWGKTYDYWEHPLADLEWHCGITYCAITTEPISSFPTIKVGCDYNHLWDQEYLGIYNEEMLRIDAESCVDSLFAKFPSLKTCREIIEAARNNRKEIDEARKGKPDPSCVCHETSTRNCPVHGNGGNEK